MIEDADAELYLKILDTWLATFAADAEGRPGPYQVWGLPGRDAFEGWLLARLDILHKLGYAVRLANEEMDGVRRLLALGGLDEADLRNTPGYPLDADEQVADQLDALHDELAPTFFHVRLPS